MTAAVGPWVAPDARQLLSADAPIETWLAERRRGIGGSDASAVLGENRWTSPYEVWLDKTGRSDPKDETQAMRMGRMLEPIVRTLFTEDTGIRVRRAGLMQSREHPLLIVSLDGMTEDGGNFEAKATNWRQAEDWDDDQVSDHAEAQVQHGLAVTGRSHAWVAALVDGRELLVRRVERDDEFIANLRDIELGFWHDYVEADVAPPVDAKALDAVKRRWATVERESVDVDPALWLDVRTQYLVAKAEAKAADEDVDAATARLRELFGDAEEIHVNGTTVATCKRTSSGRRVDAKALREAHPDIAREFEREGFYRRLHVKKES